MAPKASVIEAELTKSVRELFATDRDNLTVNTVRKNVEDKLGLDDGFLRSGQWKTKSKDMITGSVVSVFRCS